MKHEMQRRKCQVAMRKGREKKKKKRERKEGGGKKKEEGKSGEIFFKTF
jgi:hypothetical protein